MDAIFVGKERAYNRRFQQMCGHYLVDPVACTPASGWEKGQSLPPRRRGSRTRSVRYGSGCSRRGARVKSLEELNDWLADQCVARAKVQPHPEVTDKTVWEIDGRVVGDHSRAFGRGGTVYNPWHYVPVLARKPGAPRNGAPFKHWVLPATLERVRRKLRAAPDGDRRMVEILGAVLTDGLPAVETACAEAPSEGVHSADVILNILARHRDPGPPVTIMTPEAPRLACAPVAAETMLAESDLVGLRRSPVIHAAGGLLVLLVPVTLSLYKPRGMTRYGWRKQHEQRPVARP